ncbi:peptidoglycan hydrolase-like protein with peptidoglycan-binding domain [Bartonella callosciuri]|uniref:Peptidoglycan hydrolase-like protein with peptidoglycan-binding domain n=1 Tax=Bartonella callosciuri TaxID=686223 RepID=A0A840NR36_9HYPH|nr:peptidoglycan-binding protein [Bartonella callosciuri]MBB5073541.1 peptidoglycan hydrolase-like protein with peptidoglycan-binding domain [Bartonella callosciuri]
MTKKRKTRRTKNVKKRKYHSSIVITVLLISGRFLFWIAKTLYFYTRKNALFFVGFFLFNISFVFFSVNALFLQTTTYQDVFPKTKFTFAPEIEQNSTLSAKKETLHTLSRATSVPFPNNLRTNLSSHSPTENTLKIQKKLAKLGLYNGPLDGLEGPKMLRAIALWKQQAAQEKQNNSLSKPEIDEIAVLIKRSEMEMANETTKTKDISLSKETVLVPPVADIIQVQKALRLFGNQEVIVTGVEDQKTIEALRQFQKMFDLPITGKIDHTVLMKMREVGLLN